MEVVDNFNFSMIVISGFVKSSIPTVSRFCRGDDESDNKSSAALDWQ